MTYEQALTVWYHRKFPRTPKYVEAYGLLSRLGGIYAVVGYTGKNGEQTRREHLIGMTEELGIIVREIINSALGVIE